MAWWCAAFERLRLARVAALAMAAKAASKPPAKKSPAGGRSSLRPRGAGGVGQAKRKRDQRRAGAVAGGRVVKGAPGRRKAGKARPKTKRNAFAAFARAMPIATAVIVAAVILLVAVALVPGQARAAGLFATVAPFALIAVLGALAYDNLRRRMRKRLFRIERASGRRAARLKREIRRSRGASAALGKKTRQHRRAAVAAIKTLRAESAALKETLAKIDERTLKAHAVVRGDLTDLASSIKAEAAALKGLRAETVSLSHATDALRKKDLPATVKDAAFLRERVAAGERQIAALRYPDAPSCLVFFGHHKCASRFFRFQVFERVAEMTGARIRRYAVKAPPFHYSRMDDLDLCNMDLADLGKDGRDVVLFANGTTRSLERIRRSTQSFRGLRVLRDPRQVLVSNYFHHKGNHPVNSDAGWVWDALQRDRSILLSLPEEDGLLHELDSITKEVIEEQLLAPFDDERVLTIKLEEFAAEPREYLARIAEFLEVPDIAGIDLGRTFANRDSGDWRHHFTSKLRDVFKQRYGQALIDLGYARDMDW